jgi:hypothetical protein
MALKGELEGLISNHNLLISRGSVVEAAKIKELIGGYLSQKDMIPCFYKTIRDKFEEFLYCAETNYNRFREIINYKQLTQLEFFYPEIFKEFTKELNGSCEKMFMSGNPLYTGLMAASSIYTSRDILVKVVGHFLRKKNYNDLEAVFARLEETRNLKLSLSPQNGTIEETPLIADQEKAEKISMMIFEAYSDESQFLENQQIGTDASVRNAYKLGTILTVYLPEIELITDGSMATTATFYFKELARQVDIDNIADLVSFLDKFKQNPAIKRFASENPQMFESLMNGPDVRNVLGELVRNLLGKTRFEEAKVLDEALVGIISFAPIFKDHLSSLKENGFFVEAIEMAEKLQMRGEITNELKIEAFRKLMEDLHKSPIKTNFQRVRKFAIKHKINAQTYPQIQEQTTQQMDEIEKLYPEISDDLEHLYPILRIEKKEVVGALNLGKLFEPVYWFFALIFKLFIRLIIAVVTRGGGAAQEDSKQAKTAAKGQTTRQRR